MAYFRESRWKAKTTFSICQASQNTPDMQPAASKVVVKPVLSTTVTSSGQPIVLPQKDAQVIVSTYEIPPGAVLPKHKHPFPRYGYVQAGTIEVTRDPQGGNLASTLDKALTDAKPFAETEKMELAGQLSASLGTIAGDAPRLLRVIGGLLDNAIRFTAPTRRSGG